MSLQTEIDKARVQVRTDEYSMSIGEIVTMYEKGELIINPSFQRLFRWEEHQKSKFIESILLGIPIPPIFVFETKQAEWELIDGLQRISTILEFMGLLRDPKDGNELRPASQLSATAYLPSLSGILWDGKASSKHFSKPQQFEFRRARLNVQILKRQSDVQTKFDLFQRLNSGGSIATPQEIRNCAVIMANEDFFSVLSELADTASFSEVSRITEAGEIVQKNMEFVMRFFVFTEYDFDPEYDVEEFIDKHIVILSQSKPVYLGIKNRFLNTFNLLHSSAGKNALRKFDKKEKKFIGAVGQVALEAVAVGIGRNINDILKLKDPKTFVLDKIKSFWSEEDVKQFSASGVSGTKRLSETIGYGEEYFEP